MIKDINKAELALKGHIYDGNMSGIKKLLNSAKEGGEYTIAFLGGSITMGCHATTTENQYMHRVFSWFERTFPNAKFNFLNAPVGATGSQFGNARIKKQVLAFKPDFLLVEFAVNDTGDDFNKETYEGLIRTILSADKVPALLGLMNVMVNEAGDNAEVQHLEVLRHYGIPAVSMKQNIFPEICSGNLVPTDYSGDSVHPNDFGHEMIGLTINTFLDKVNSTEVSCDCEDKPLPSPITANRYEKAVWMKNYDICPETDGFTEDHEPAPYDGYYFIDGWVADKLGASLKLNLSMKALAVQYEKYAKAVAPKATLILDGKTEVILDANFEEDWGNCLYLQNIFCEDEVKEHSIEIKLTDVPDGSVPFYLISFIAYK